MEVISHFLNIIEKKSFISYIYVFIFALLIFRIPLLSKFLRVFYTLFHESGHTLFAFITNSKTSYIKLHYNLSGTALTKSDSKFKQFIISFAGYPFAAFCAWLLFYLLHNDYENIALFSLIAIVSIQLLLNLRNTFGILWSLSVLVLLILLYLYLKQYIFHSLAVIASLITLESMISSVIIFYLSLRYPQKAGDTTNLAKITHIPAALWGLVFLSISLLFIYFTFLIIKK